MTDVVYVALKELYNRQGAGLRAFELGASLTASDIQPPAGVDIGTYLAQFPRRVADRQPAAVIQAAKSVPPAPTPAPTSIATPAPVPAGEAHMSAAPAPGGRRASRARAGRAVTIEHAAGARVDAGRDRPARERRSPASSRFGPGWRPRIDRWVRYPRDQRRPGNRRDDRIRDASDTRARG